jgi:orotidine-5'-phosphate decarboxylase
MNYLEQLKTDADRYGSIVCLGLDPVIGDIPLKSGTAGEKIAEFYEGILNAMVGAKVYPASIKPNYAFYAQYGFDGLQALHKVIRLYRDAGFPVILDVKRGDIGKTADAYSREAFEFFEADAVTLSPYMGYDSISPFIKNYPEKGYYILNKTSNKSSGDLQDIDTNGEPVYIHVCRKILDWYHPGIGAVVGATYPEQLEKIEGIFRASGKEVPMLIPGVGSQGGSVADVMKVLKSGDWRLHRINSSSAINYAYRKHPGLDYARAAVKALGELNDEIGACI